MSRARPPLSRRAAIKMTGTTVMLGAASATLAACDTGGEERAAAVDQLVDQADRARADAAAATAAIALVPDKSVQLTTISTERTAHAAELDAEITRAAGAGPTTSTPAPATTAPSGLDAVRTSLTESARAAADLGRTMTGYRAGLLASVSASCTAQVAVLLA